MDYVCQRCMGSGVTYPSGAPYKVETVAADESRDAMDEVNAARATKGLRPFVKDDCLTTAAYACAVYRAEHHRAGHTQNDFAYLPPGCHADCAGCAAWADSWGFGACAMYETWSAAGAAWKRGSDGLRYMHVFYRS